MHQLSAPADMVWLRKVHCNVTVLGMTAGLLLHHTPLLHPTSIRTCPCPPSLCHHLPLQLVVLVPHQHWGLHHHSVQALQQVVHLWPQANPFHLRPMLARGLTRLRGSAQACRFHPLHQRDVGFQMRPYMGALDQIRAHKAMHIARFPLSLL